MSYQYWTTTEEKHLSASWGTKPYQEIAEELNRSANAVLLRASRMGLASPRTVRTKHNSAVLKEMIEFGAHPTKIAETFGITTKAVYNLVKDRLDSGYYRKLLNNVRKHNAARKRPTPIMSRCEETQRLFSPIL